MTQPIDELVALRAENEKLRSELNEARIIRPEEIKKLDERYALKLRQARADADEIRAQTWEEAAKLMLDGCSCCGDLCRCSAPSCSWCDFRRDIEAKAARLRGEGKE